MKPRPTRLDYTRPPKHRPPSWPFTTAIVIGFVVASLASLLGAAWIHTAFSESNPRPHHKSNLVAIGTLSLLFGLTLLSICLWCWSQRGKG